MLPEDLWRFQLSFKRFPRSVDSVFWTLFCQSDTQERQHRKSLNRGNTVMLPCDHFNSVFPEFEDSFKGSRGSVLVELKPITVAGNHDEHSGHE